MRCEMKFNVRKKTQPDSGKRNRRISEMCLLEMELFNFVVMVDI